MKTRIFVLSVVVMMPLLLLGQNSNLSHSVGIYTGYANRSHMHGMSLQCQYALGVCPHLDVLASVSFVNVFDKNTELFIVSDTYSPITFISYLNFFDFGVRTYVDFLKICSFKLSGRIGMYTDYRGMTKIHSLDMFGWNVAAKGELAFNVCQKLDIGIYYEYAHAFERSYLKVPHIHMAGLLLNLKL